MKHDGAKITVHRDGRQSVAGLFRKLIDPADPKQVDEFHQAFRPTIPVDRALLCLDCESIFEAQGTQQCPSCGSRIAWALNRALSRVQSENRETKDEGMVS
jgi:hypothetical protein